MVMDNDTDTHKGKYKGRVMHVNRLKQMDRVRQTDRQEYGHGHSQDLGQRHMDAQWQKYGHREKTNYKKTN
jgi:hypothetical protein